MTFWPPSGWIAFAPDPGTARWARAAEDAADQALQDPDLAHWYQCENTWFVGVDALPNDPTGAVQETPLTGPAITALTAAFGPLPPLHKAQVSVMFPGYPKPRSGESDAAFRYRLNRDAAHVDGVLAQGPDRRRFVREPHAWILGLPLNDSPPEAAPLVIWEGSHKIMAQAFGQAFQDHPPSQWGDIDVTDIYQTARRQVFETCRRVPIHGTPGAAYLIHPLALHGVAPWDAQDGPGRKIAYFRPECPGGITDWLAEA